VNGSSDSHRTSHVATVRPLQRANSPPSGPFRLPWHRDSSLCASRNPHTPPHRHLERSEKSHRFHSGSRGAEMEVRCLRRQMGAGV